MTALQYFILGCLIVLGTVIVAIVAVIIANVAKNKPSSSSEVDIVMHDIDTAKVSANLASAIQIPSISLSSTNSNSQPFLQFHSFLKSTYPAIFDRAEVTLVNGYSIVIKIEGSDSSLLPGCYISHMDVVPAPAEGWSQPPFSGAIVDDIIYGRGTLDMKGQLIASLEAFDYLLGTGFEPARGLYFCFGHDEETNGSKGTGKIVEHLLSHGVTLEYVIDEGGIILDGTQLGVTKPLAMIGTCEKGYMDIQLSATVAGGHASTPDNSSAIAQVAHAIVKLNKSPMKAYISTPIDEMITQLSPHMKGEYKLLFSNVPIFRRGIVSDMTKISTMTNALVRTTFAPTQACGAEAANVLPRTATATINARINIGQTSDDVLAYVQKVVGKNIQVTNLMEPIEPTPCSSTTSDAYANLVKSIQQSYSGFIPAPYPFVAGTDAKYYYPLTNNIYRFAPFIVDEVGRYGMHAVDECITVTNYTTGIQFYINHMLNSLSK